MRFAGRLVFGTFLVVTLAVLILAWQTQRVLRESLERDLRASLADEARFAAGSLPIEPTLWPAAVQRLSAASGHRIVVRGADSTVLAASDSTPVTETISVSAKGGPGQVEVIADRGRIDAVLDATKRSVTGAVIVVLLLALVLAWFTGRSIAQPLVALSDTARAIAAGAAPRFPRSGVPEVDALVEALRRMHRDLADRFDELQHEQAEGTALVDAMEAGVIATDGRGRIVTANPAARRLLGYPPDAPLPDLPTLFRVKSAREAIAEVLAGAPVQDREFELDASVISLNARPLPGNGAVVVLHDLTAIRRLEAVRRDFVANVSHELKTPLTSISGYAETLTDPAMDETTRLRFVSTILTNARRMQRLVDDLLDLSRIEAGRWTPKPEWVEVDVLATESWSPFSDRATARRITFARAIDEAATRVKADPDTVRHVLGNLFDNALRHTGPDGHITIRSEHEDDGVTLSVVDDGAGIPAEHLPRIFERFYRVDPARSREEGGTGLGLAIVKHLVEAHGGRVSAASVPREGTIIRCWFPDTSPIEAVAVPA